MDLILWRHADAGDAVPGEIDMERPLTPKGEKQAARMAAWLERQLPAQTRIVCSPATRAEQTVRALGRKYKLREELVPMTDPQSVLDLVQWPNGKGVVLVVGHQPSLGGIAAQLLGIPELNWSVKKGSVWWLRHRARNGVAQTVIVTVQSPDFL